MIIIIKKQEKRTYMDKQDQISKLMLSMLTTLIPISIVIGTIVGFVNYFFNGVETGNSVASGFIMFTLCMFVSMAIVTVYGFYLERKIKS